MENKNNKIWKKWWFWVVIILLLIAMAYTEPDVENELVNVSNNLENLNISNQVLNSEVKYADDVVINNFITDFKTISNYELANIKKGNIKTKYSVDINGQYCQLLNAIGTEANYFEIVINGGNKEDDIAKISNVYKEVVKVLDSTIEDSQINNTISAHINSKSATTTFNINDKITVKYYPSVSLSYGNSDCRIEITTTIYN